MSVEEFSLLMQALGWSFGRYTPGDSHCKYCLNEEKPKWRKIEFIVFCNAGHALKWMPETYKGELR